MAAKPILLSREKMLPASYANLQTCEASTTLLCLNGLKSSLMWTGVLFLIGRAPKKGLGVEGLCWSTLSFELRPGKYSYQFRFGPWRDGRRSRWCGIWGGRRLEYTTDISEKGRQQMRKPTFATGLNEEALTFNLFAAVFGDTGA